jgi:Domain of unknown function (DUF1844)
MNTANVPSDQAEARVSALFQTLMAQQVNMALICLGQTPDQTGQKNLDLEGARFFIDLLEMLATKTKGNLTKNEAALLNQSLTALRLSFVEATNAAPPKAAPSAPPDTPPSDTAPSPAEPLTEPSGDLESRKKFSKKY